MSEHSKNPTWKRIHAAISRSAQGDGTESSGDSLQDKISRARKELSDLTEALQNLSPEEHAQNHWEYIELVKEAKQMALDAARDIPALADKAISMMPQVPEGQIPESPGTGISRFNSRRFR